MALVGKMCAEMDGTWQNIVSPKLETKRTTISPRCDGHAINCHERNKTLMMRLWTRDEVYYELPLAGEAQPRESEEVDMQNRGLR